MTQVVKVAKIGKSADSDDPNDFIFHSDYNTFKIIDKGKVDFLISDGTTEENSLVHNMSYIPLVSAFMGVDSETEIILPNCKFDSALYRDVFFQSVSSDATNIYFKVTNNKFSDVTVHFRYYIFEVPL